jgi:hypothetical protein
MTNAASPAALLINDRTAAEWAELAAHCRAESIRCTRQSAESFARSDTDGSLSQWASDSMAREYDAKAHWADAQGWGEANVLTDLTGRIVSTLEKEGKFGRDYWVLDDAAAEAYGKRFFTESAAQGWDKKAAANRAKGFVVARAIVPTHAPKLKGSTYSLSVWAEPMWDDVKEMLAAGTLELVHADWLMHLYHTYDVPAAARDAARVSLTKDEPAAAKPAVKRASGSHGGCSHEATKSARAACRKARV